MSLILGIHGRHPRFSCRSYRALCNMEEGEQVGMYRWRSYRVLLWYHRVARHHFSVEWR